jgi:ElaB/YqjD/DUF883 family membrane-anchored ribosome-binding protein
VVTSMPDTMGLLTKRSELFQLPTSTEKPPLPGTSATAGSAPVKVGNFSVCLQDVIRTFSDAQSLSRELIWTGLDQADYIVRSHPWEAAGLGGAIGMLIGAILARR